MRTNQKLKKENTNLPHNPPNPPSFIHIMPHSHSLLPIHLTHSSSPIPRLGPDDLSLLQHPIKLEIVPQASPPPLILLLM